ncbi:bucentaur or craniofacial development-domain-containing protein [Boletus coccyginus]|nr:bucentaur or craniofacial development-domain-containing protein [Boletus coccyginus]
MPLTTNSDSEDDFDYVPPADDPDSDSPDEQDKVGTSAETALDETDPASEKKQRDALWATFQASVSTPPSRGGNGPPVVKRVKIERTFLFAGVHVKDVVEVPEDSEEAKKWPRWSSSPRPTSDAMPTPCRDNGETEEGTCDNAVPPPADPSPGPAPPLATTTPTLGAKRPGPRKSRTALPVIPKASQAKKITTLDKSAMEWRAHVASQSSDLKDELDANRRGGGYLEKVDFLKRVEDRREDAFEASKSSKRRKT